MLKTLRITSLAVVVLAICGVLFIVFLGLRENPAIMAYLDAPGVVDQYKDRVTDGGQAELESPLIAQARALALRLDPPPPPAPVKPVTPPARTATPAPTRTPPPQPAPPTPPVPTTGKFTLLATVLCESNPKRSMVLLRQAGNKDDWFWQGERVGNLDIDEVRNGSAIFSQSGRNKQELFVPAKPQTKSLLKADASGSQPLGGGTSSMTVRLDAETGAAETAADIASAGSRPVMTDVDRSSAAERSEDIAARRAEVSSRIQRLRTVPKPPTPVEQRESIEGNIDAIQSIMNREDSGADDAQRAAENEAWKKLLEALQSEKEKLPTAADAATEDQNDASGTDETGESNTASAPSDPNA